MLDPKFRSGIWAYLLQTGQSTRSEESFDKSRASSHDKSKDKIDKPFFPCDAPHQGSLQLPLKQFIPSNSEFFSTIAPYCCTHGGNLVLSSAITADAIATAAVMSMLWWIKPRSEEISAVEWNSSRIVRMSSGSPKTKYDTRSRSSSEDEQLLESFVNISSKTSVNSEEEAIVGWHR